MFFRDTGWNGHIDWRFDGATVVDPTESSAEPFAADSFHCVAGSVMI
jgi:hypothetical protein